MNRGDRVIGTVRDTKKVTDLIERYPQTFHAELRDRTDPAAIRALVERSFAQRGWIDALIRPRCRTCVLKAADASSSFFL